LWFGAQFKQTTNGVGGRERGTRQPGGEGRIEAGRYCPAGQFNDSQGCVRVEPRINQRGGESGHYFSGAPRELDAQHHDADVPEENRFNAALIQKKTGLTLRLLTAQDAAKLGLKGAGGFVVADIERNSPADHAGFQRGLIVEGIRRRAPARLDHGGCPAACSEKRRANPRG
jgi:hypothetical protein